MSGFKSKLMIVTQISTYIHIVETTSLLMESSFLYFNEENKTNIVSYFRSKTTLQLMFKIFCFENL